MHRRRLRILFVGLVVAFLAVEGRLFYLQVVRGEHYRDYADRQCVGLVPLDVARARILTGDGVVLAEDRLRYDLVVVIGRLDPAHERAIRRPLRRLFWVPHHHKLVRVTDASWRLRNGRADDGQETVVEAESRLEVEVPGPDHEPLLKLVDRKTEFALPRHLLRSVARLARMTRPDERELVAAAGNLVEAARAPRREPLPGPVLAAARRVGTAAAESGEPLRRGLRNAADALHKEIKASERSLPAGLLAAADRLRRLTRDRRRTLLADVLDAAIDVARLRAPVLSPVPIVKDVDYERVVVPVETRPDAFRGFEIRGGRRRHAEARLAPHLVGYVSTFTGSDVERAARKYPGWPGPGYFMQLRAGRDGVERAFDELLRGRFGVECIERDHMNRRQRELATAPATPGRDLVLTIDSRLQKIVEDQMAHALYRDGRPAVGAAVFLDVRNGHVLAVASSPAYDPACFRDAHAYRRVVQDPDRPLFNRALRGRLPLGSVFKVVTALAALEHGTVPAGVDCTGRVRCGRRYFRCHRAHGHVDLREGIQRSCNSFFYITARKTGDRALIEMARRLGFGRKTGLRFPDEASGNVPVRAPGGQLLNLAIGQGELVVTPLQVARMMAAVANGGTLVPPRLVRELRPFQSDGGGEPPADPRPPVDLDLSDASLAAVGDGLYRVVNEPGGTGRRAFAHWSRPFQVCGKTSTAQRTVRRDGEVTADNVGWFAGYAPHKTPRVAFAVAVERLSGGQSGGRTAGPIARDILERIPLDLLGLGAGGGAEP